MEIKNLHFRFTNKNLALILESAQTKVDEMVAYFVENYDKDNNQPITAYDIELYTLGIVSDLIKAFGRYIRSTDEVKNISISVSKGVIAFNLQVIRDEQTYYMSTNMIIAGGYNIQRRHYRYLVDTKLPASIFNPDYDALIEKQNKLTKLEKLNKELEFLNKRYSDELATFEDRKQKTQDEIFKESHLSNYSWDKISDQAKLMYKTEADFIKHVENEKIVTWNRHLEQCSDVKKKVIHAFWTKAIDKIKAKINNLISSK